jgi:hypothetical protein
MLLSEAGRTKKIGKGKNARRRSGWEPQPRPSTTHQKAAGNGEEHRRTIDPHQVRHDRFAKGQLFLEIAPVLASIPGHLTWTNVRPEKPQSDQHEPSTVETIGTDSTENGLVIGEVCVFHLWLQRRFMYVCVIWSGSVANCLRFFQAFLIMVSGLSRYRPFSPVIRILDRDQQGAGGENGLIPETTG